MSGRPLNNTIWCNGTPNYPAGSHAWSGTSTVNLPAYNYLTPGLPVAAQEFNYVLNNMSKSVSDFQDYAAQAPAVVWTQGEATVSTVAGAITATPFWNDTSCRWNVPIQLAGGSPWTNFIKRDMNNGVNIDDIVISNASTNKYVSAVANNTTTWCVAQMLDSTTGSNNIIGADLAWTSTTSTAVPRNAQFEHIFWFNNLFVLISASPAISNGGSPPDVPVFFSTPDSVTLTDRSLGTQSSLLTSFNTTKAWSCASNGSMIVALPRSNNNISATTVDGTTWVLHAPAAGTLKGVQGVCYDSVNQLWVAVSCSSFTSDLPATGSSSLVWHSTDGIVWSNVATFTSARFSGIAAIGSLLSCIDFYTGEVFYSTDTGLTWFSAGYIVDVSSSVAVTAGLRSKWTRPQVTSNGRQFVISATSGIHFGQVATAANRQIT